MITAEAGFVTLISCIDSHVGSTPSGGNYRVIGPAGQVIGSTTYLPLDPQNFTFRGKIVLQAGQALTIVCEATEGGEDPFDCTVAGDLLLPPS